MSVDLVNMMENNMTIERRVWIVGGCVSIQYFTVVHGVGL